MRRQIDDDAEDLVYGTHPSARPRAQMLFMPDGRDEVAPIPARLGDGSLRRPDGVEALSLAQAERHSGVDRKSLRERWIHERMPLLDEPDARDLRLLGALRAWLEENE